MSNKYIHFVILFNLSQTIILPPNSHCGNFYDLQVLNTFKLSLHVRTCSTSKLRATAHSVQRWVFSFHNNFCLNVFSRALEHVRGALAILASPNNDIKTI